MTNWVPDQNRCKLPKPPAWFLKAMWDQDAGLVLFPSRVRHAYILGRRREHSLRVPMLVKAHNKLMAQTRGSDGDMLAANNCQYVDVIKGNVYGGSWNPIMLQELKDRDTWAQGGAKKYADKLDAADAKVESETKRKWDADMEVRARDSWRSYQARTGQRNHHAKNVVREKSSSSSTAGLGAA